MLVYFSNIWSILRPFEIFYGHFIYFLAIWYIFLCFGILNKEKSGYPAVSPGSVALWPSHPPEVLTIRV
jgi:hypothetical protein